MSNRKKQRTVREGQLNKTLESFNEEMGQKLAESLVKFHSLYVAPLEARIKNMEEWITTVSFGDESEPIPQYVPLPAGEVVMAPSAQESSG